MVSHCIAHLGDKAWGPRRDSFLIPWWLSCSCHYEIWTALSYPLEECKEGKYFSGAMLTSYTREVSGLSSFWSPFQWEFVDVTNKRKDALKQQCAFAPSIVIYASHYSLGRAEDLGKVFSGAEGENSVFSLWRAPTSSVDAMENEKGLFHAALRDAYEPSKYQWV